MEKERDVLFFKSYVWGLGFWVRFADFPVFSGFPHEMRNGNKDRVHLVRFTGYTLRGKKRGPGGNLKVTWN